MKKVLIFIILIVVGLLLYKVAQQKRQNITPHEPLNPTTTKPTVENVPATGVRQSLFVPYWTMSNGIDSQEYDRLIYFGIAPDENGIDRSDPGYKNLSTFISLSENKTRLLTVRMVNTKINSLVLEDKKLRDKIIADSIDVAILYGFDGIVLDYELSALSFPSVVSGVSEFVSAFHTKAKDNKLSFAMTIFGDTFYRFRPYEVKTLAKNTDEFFIMAYDFHKARENPGPNFPYEGKKIYGYDFITMISDFTRHSPKEKITVVFGLFGYDWEIDTKNQSVGLAKPLSFLEAQQKFITRCVIPACIVKRDEESQETQVTYEEDGVKHVVWFEDLTSVAKKRSYLQEKGIQSISYWAHSYF